jgi:uncharacterized protein YhhL (DUF1145 family)
LRATVCGEVQNVIIETTIWNVDCGENSPLVTPRSEQVTVLTHGISLMVLGGALYKSIGRAILMWIVEKKSPLVTPRSEGVTILTYGISLMVLGGSLSKSIGRASLSC